MVENYEYEKLIKKEKEILHKKRFIAYVLNYKLGYFNTLLHRIVVDIDLLYEFILQDNPFSKRDYFYSLFTDEKHADTFWTRFVDNYLNKEYIRKEIENEKSILQK